MRLLKFTITLFILTCNFFSIAQFYDVFVSDVSASQILKYSQDGSEVSVFIPPAEGGLSSPQDIIFLENDSLVLVSSFYNNQIKKYHLRTGEYLGVWGTGTQPTRMAFGPEDTLLYVLQWAGSGKVLRFKLDGTFLGEHTTVGVNSSIGMAWDVNDNLYVSSYYENTVSKFDPAGNYLGVFASTNVVGPTNIWFEENGDLMVLNYNNNRIVRFDSLGNFISTFSTGFHNPEGVALLPSGNLLVSNSGSGDIYIVDHESGAITGEFVGTGGPLDSPNAVVLRPYTPVATLPEEDSPTNLILHPVSSIFLLNAASNLTIQSATIYDLSGKLVDNVIPSGNLLWNATNAAEGNYIITLLTTENKMVTQHIVVRH